MTGIARNIDFEDWPGDRIEPSGRFNPTINEYSDRWSLEGRLDWLQTDFDPDRPLLHDGGIDS